MICPTLPDSIVLRGFTYYPSREKQRTSKDNPYARYLKFSSGLPLIAHYDLHCCSILCRFHTGKPFGQWPTHGERWANVEVLLFAAFLAVIFNPNWHCGWTQTAPTTPTRLLMKMCIPSQPAFSSTSRRLVGC